MFSCQDKRAREPTASPTTVFTGRTKILVSDRPANSLIAENKPLDVDLTVDEQGPFFPDFFGVTVTATGVIQDYDPTTATWDWIDGLLERHIQAFALEASANTFQLYNVQTSQRHLIFRTSNHSGEFELSAADIAAGRRYYGVRLNLEITDYGEQVVAEARAIDRKLAGIRCKLH